MQLRDMKSRNGAVLKENNKGRNRDMTETMKLVTCGLTGRRNLDIDYLQKALDEYSDDLSVVCWIRNILRALAF